MMSASEPDDFACLTPMDLRDWLDEGRPFTLLDVRDPGERRIAMIAVEPPVRDLFVPLRGIPDRLSEIREVVGNEPIVIYCHHGVRSAMAAGWLVGQGLGEMAHLEGGIDAWSLRVDPRLPRYD